jgi:hypothetical protein
MLSFNPHLVCASGHTHNPENIFLAAGRADGTGKELPEAAEQSARNHCMPLPWWNVCRRDVGRAARATLICALLCAPVLAAENEPPATGKSGTPMGQQGTAPTLAGAASTAVGEAVIPAGQEELLAAMLGKGATLPDQCKLAGAEIDHSIVKATYTCLGGEVVFKLAHPSNAPASATHTARFAITVLSGSPPADLAPALASLITSREAAFEWKFLAPADTASRFSLAHVALAAAGLLGIAALGWVLRRRMSGRAG